MSTETRLLAGRYELGEVLGRGGMAEVRLAKDTVLGRSVAIKLLRPDLTGDSMLQTRFRREAKAAASLNDRSIVAVFDTGDEVMPDKDGNLVRVPFIVMEYIDGGTIKDLLHQGPISRDRALEITDGILHALSYSHRVGIVHRDIKPGNIMLGGRGQAKVMDFGIARAMADSASTDTKTQVVVGTAQYLSPEQARGSEVDHRSDLYSTGCVLYELLTGRPPFLGDTPVAIAYQHVREAPVPPSRLNPDLPPEADAVVLHALAKSPEARYQTAQEFREDIRALRRGEKPKYARELFAPEPVPGTAEGEPEQPDGSGIPATSGQPASQRKRRRRLAWILGAIAVVVLALGGTGGWMYANQTGIFQPAETHAVPDLQRVNVRNAIEHLTSLGFRTLVLSEYSDSIPKDAVIRTNPKSGEAAELGSTVTLSVSLGPETMKVPNLAGQDIDYAKKILEGIGLKTGAIHYEHSSRYDEGIVIRSEPTSGKVVDPDSSVDLIVADGKIELPSVIGLDKDYARSQLVALGLIVTVSFQETDVASPDTIFSQSLEPGVVDKGSSITLLAAVEPTDQNFPSPTATPTPSESSPSETPPPSTEPSPSPSSQTPVPTTPSPSVSESPSPSSPEPSSSSPSPSPSTTASSSPSTEPSTSSSSSPSPQSSSSEPATSSSSTTPATSSSSPSSNPATTQPVTTTP